MVEVYIPAIFMKFKERKKKSQIKCMYAKLMKCMYVCMHTIFN